MQIVVLQTHPEIVLELAFEDEEVSHELLESATNEVLKAESVKLREATILTETKAVQDNLEPVIIGKGVTIEVLNENEPTIQEEATDTSGFIEKPANRLTLTQTITNQNNTMQELGVLVDSVREKYCGDFLMEIDTIDSKTGEITYKEKDLSQCPQFTLAPIQKPVEEEIIEPIEELVNPIEEIEPVDPVVIKK